MKKNFSENPQKETLDHAAHSLNHLLRRLPWNGIAEDEVRTAAAEIGAFSVFFPQELLCE